MNKIQKKRRGTEGFTLVELICVVAILAILVAVAVPSYQSMQTKSAEQVALANARAEYTAGKAQQSLLDAGVMEPEDAAESTYDPVTDSATWEGEINGKIYTATYSGQTGEGTVSGK